MKIGAWMVLAVGLLVACVKPGDVQCDQGVICPAGYVCSAYGCLSPEQLEACSGKADGEACSTASGGGECGDGACLVSRCGNGVVEGLELCDDNNSFSGDGCSGTCRSDETCGNGIPELEEQCDCGDAEHPGPVGCGGTSNGGAVCSETCERRTCGNMIVDPGEVCDDGNENLGDGCAFQCLSDESCQNGIVDFAAGEQCDDQNGSNHDGCSTTCQLETQLWVDVTVGTTPPPRRHMAMAYDAGRRKTVMFGGATDFNAYEDTWELDGSSWTRRTPATHPGPRTGHAMTYDSKRGRIVMFGGINATALDETWEYDGANWELLSPATKPPGRYSHAMTYDSKRGRVIVFGGWNAAGTQIGDTWEFDGTTWAQTATTGPSARTDTAMAYDPVRNVTVLFGGGTSSFPSRVRLNDTWEYNGTSWSQKSPTASPPARDTHVIAFDAGRGRIVIQGGYRVFISSGPSQDTWQFDGTTWAAVTGTALSPTRRQHAMAYDSYRNRLVIFGGSSQPDDPAASRTFYGDTGENDGANWATRTFPTGLTPRGSHAVAFDTLRGRAVLFGGNATATTSSLLGDTWELRGDAWVQQAPGGTPPSARVSHAMTYDAGRGRVVLFGGADGTALGDTYEYDGTNWSLVTTITTPPSARVGHALAYDAKRGRVVLFGGGTASYLTNNQTWEFDGSNWTQKSPTMSPESRFDHVMVYDTKRERIVMFGGQANNQDYYTDTWEYDGTTWSKLAVNQNPSARFRAAMAYDETLGRVVLHGGALGNGKLDDTWLLSGSTWTQFQPLLGAPIPSARTKHAMVYDTVGKRLITVGGIESTGNLSPPYEATLADTWSFTYGDIAASEVCTSKLDWDGDSLLGCNDPDCWGVCTPRCPPTANQATCPTTPRCGDGVCGGVEDCRSCPADCAAGTSACPTRCGDFYCDPSENATSCPGDC